MLKQPARRVVLARFLLAGVVFASVALLGVAQDSRRGPASRPKPPEFQGTVKFADAPSKLLGRAVHYLVYLPKGYDAPENAKRVYPTLYYLHGLFENADRW